MSTIMGLSEPRNEDLRARRRRKVDIKALLKVRVVHHEAG